MKTTVKVIGNGIRCDACDWKNMDVKIEDCENWLNKPCPKCGANLLTETDLKIMESLLSLIEVINNLTPLYPDDTPTTGLSIETNGTGAVIIKGD